MSHLYLAQLKICKLLDEVKAQKINLAVISIPGCGLSHYLKIYSHENAQDTAYISSLSNIPVLQKLNIIDISFINNPNIYEQIDQIWLSAHVDQKFVIIIDDPGWIRSDFAKSAQFISRIYRTEYFPVHSPVDIRQLAVEKNPEISKDNINKVVELSAGLAKLVKYIAIRSDFSSNWWLQDDQLKSIIMPTLTAISHCTDSELDLLGLRDENHFVSPIISDLLSAISNPQNFDISISPNLDILENGQSFGKKVTAIESQIIAQIIKSGQISKEKIADIKWGTGSYDSFSDQAIKKTMMRLSIKFKKYRLKSITKIGYQFSLR